MSCFKRKVVPYENDSSLKINCTKDDLNNQPWDIIFWPEEESLMQKKLFTAFYSSYYSSGWCGGHGNIMLVLFLY